MLKSYIQLFSVLAMIICASNVASQCSISDIEITNTECDDTEKYSIEINFTHSDSGENGFQVLGNGTNYGTFQYDELPITIEGLIGNCELELEFIIRDIDDPACAGFTAYGPVCCDQECDITIVDFATSECENNIFFDINFDLEYDQVGNDGFSVAINDMDIGNFEYEALPIAIDDFPDAQDGLNIITVCDLDNPECCATFEFLNPCVCTFSNIITEIVECVESDTSYYVLVNFDHVATNDSFQMGYSNQGDNVFLGTFAYSNLPILAGPIYLSEVEQEILIVDTDDFFCFNSAYLGTVDDCNIECQLFNLFAEPFMCEEGQYFMEVEFEGADLEGSNFEIYVDDISYGSFEYGENSYTVGPIPSNCDLAPTVIVQDSQEEFCFDFYNLSEPVCCPSECNFTSFEASVSCGLDIMTINGIFENDGTMFSSFYFIQLLGTSYGPFLYGDFTFELQVPLLQNGEYEITINDSGDPECSISTTFLVQCDEEPCLIFDVFAEANECEEELFFVDIEFDFAGEVSDSFTIVGNGMEYGTFFYGEQFYTVGPLVGDCETIYEFVITDQEEDMCNSSFSFLEPICCQEICNLSDYKITEVICEDEFSVVSFVLDFDYSSEGSDSFKLEIDGNLIGNYNYSELPLDVEVIASTVLTIVVTDQLDPDCFLFEEMLLECSNLDCEINEIITEFVECTEEGDFYFVDLDFNYENISDSFGLIADTIIGNFSYDELPLRLGPIPINTEIDVLVYDLDIDECQNEFSLFLEKCETSLEDSNIDEVEVIQFSNAIQIQNPSNKDYNFQLISISGIVLDIFMVSSNQTKDLKTDNLQAGIYLLSIEDQETQRVVKVVVF